MRKKPAKAVVLGLPDEGCHRTEWKYHALSGSHPQHILT
jgi:hypothetical protein